MVGEGRTCGCCSGKTTFLMENTEKVREDSGQGQEIWQCHITGKSTALHKAKSAKRNV